MKKEIKCSIARDLLKNFKNLNGCIQHILSKEDWECWEESLKSIEKIINQYLVYDES